MESDALEALIVAMPKAELHVHLEGSVTPEFACRLAARHGAELPGQERGVEGLREAYRFASFHDFLQLYLAVTKCFVDANDFAEATIDLCRQLAAQNVRYAEVTFTPWTHVSLGRPVQALHEGLREGRSRGREQYGVELRWVFDVVRSFPDQAESTVGFALDHRKVDPTSVVGIGVGGPEADRYPMDQIAQAFARGRSEGLKSLPHAGENAGASSMWTAVRELEADRIGHGIRCLEDPALVEHLIEHRVPIEVCPHSNVALGVVPTLEAHPLPKLLAAGVPLSLGSDDPPMFHTDLLNELRGCARAFEWEPRTVIDLCQAALEHSFAPEDLKKRLLAEQQAVVKRLGLAAEPSA